MLGVQGEFDPGYASHGGAGQGVNLNSHCSVTSSVPLHWQADSLPLDQQGSPKLSLKERVMLS